MESISRSQFSAIQRLINSAEDGLTKREIQKGTPIFIIKDGVKEPILPSISDAELQELINSGLIKPVSNEKYTATDLAKDRLPEWKKNLNGNSVSIINRRLDFSKYPFLGGTSAPLFNNFQPLRTSNLFNGIPNQSHIKELIKSNITVDSLIRDSDTSLPSGKIFQNYFDFSNIVNVENISLFNGLTNLHKNLLNSTLSSIDFGVRFPSLSSQDYNEILKSLKGLPNWLSDIDEYWGWIDPLRTIDDLGVLTEMIADEGIPLIGASEPELITNLLSAEDFNQREEILIQNSQNILEFCLLVTEKCASDGEKEFMREEFESYESGHHRSIQTLSACLLETLYHEYINRVSPDEINKKYRNSDNNGPLNKKWYLSRKSIEGDVIHPKEISQRFKQETVANQLLYPLFLSTMNSFGNQEVPERYNRHATVHRALEVNYNEANSLIAIMTNTALIWGKNPVNYSSINANGRP